MSKRAKAVGPSGAAVVVPVAGAGADAGDTDGEGKDEGSPGNGGAGGVGGDFQFRCSQRFCRFQTNSRTASTRHYNQHLTARHRIESLMRTVQGSTVDSLREFSAAQLRGCLNEALTNALDTASEDQQEVFTTFDMNMTEPMFATIFNGCPILFTSTTKTGVRNDKYTVTLYGRDVEQGPLTETLGADWYTAEPAVGNPNRLFSHILTMRPDGAEQALNITFRSRTTSYFDTARHANLDLTVSKLKMNFTRGRSQRTEKRA